MKKILQLDNRIEFIENSTQVTISDKLDVGIYDVKITKQNIFLEKRNLDKFIVVEKTYGALPQLESKLICDIRRHDKLGIMLIGEKGSGKSLLAKRICNQINLPIIVLNSPDATKENSFSTFIQSIPNKFVLFIDEFEKIFNYNDDSYRDNDGTNKNENTQHIFLTLFDGSSNINCITLLTANDNCKISPYFLNRTNRIKYYIKFDYLSTEDIIEVFNDKQVSKNQCDKILNIHRIIGNLNYDLLIEIINELKEYPEYSVNDIIYFLNIHHTNIDYDIEIYAEHINNFKTLIGQDKDYCNPFEKFHIDSRYITDERNLVIEIRKTFYDRDYTITEINNKCFIITLMDKFNEQTGRLRFVFKKIKNIMYNFDNLITK